MERLATLKATAAEGENLDADPEGVLPVQFFAGLPSMRAFQPEKDLLLAVLKDALKTYRKYARASRPRGRRRFAEVEEWFGSDEESDSPFSFLNLCAALGLDETCVRQQLWKWRGRQRATVKASASPCGACSHAA